MSRKNKMKYVLQYKENCVISEKSIFVFLAKVVILILSAAGLFKYVWPFSGYPALKSSIWEIYAYAEILFIKSN